jgi:hypothetical protein
MQLPVPQGAVHGANPSSKTDANGVLFYACFAGSTMHVYKMVGGAAVEVTLEHACTARGLLDVDSDGAAYLTGWDDHATALWRMVVPGFAPIPKAGGLSARYTKALDRLCAFFGI